ncbi:MAG: AAA family ATPase [Candidatus Gottesmanbacteria bacterium]|nr:AAA family ATPase [Candidatus Gottesmanbacteria bacterium]
MSAEKKDTTRLGFMKRGRQEREEKTEEGNFVVTIEDDKELYNFLRPLKGFIRFAPQEFRLGYTPLTGVLQEVELSVSTTGQEIGFEARFLRGGISSSLPIPYSTEHLKKRLNPVGLKVETSETPDSGHVLAKRTNIGTPSSNFWPDLFVIQDITEEDSLRGLEISNLHSLFTEWRKIEDFNQFTKEVGNFCLTVQALVEAVYIEANQKIPKMELVLRKEPIDKKILLAAVGEERTVSLTETTETETVEVPAVIFEDIGGQKDAVEKLREISFALKNPESFQRWGSRLPKGVLLVGSPGNGKTLLGKAMAHEAKACFVPVNISDILSCWVGRSEGKVTALFDEAKRRDGKTILFFDEIDALGRSRDKTTHDYTASLLLTINQNMDGIRVNPNVIVLGTTNKKEDIDPALLREGRFDMIINVPLPDTIGRVEILAIHMAKAEKEAGGKVFDEINLRSLSEKTEGSSGARLVEIIRRVTWKRGVREAKAKEEGQSVDRPFITTEEILEVIESYEER